MDSETAPVFCVAFRMTVTPSDASRSASRMLTTSDGLKRESCKIRTTSRSSASAMRPRSASYSLSETSFGFAAICFGGLFILNSVPRHLRYRFTAVALLLREFGLYRSRIQVSYSWRVSRLRDGEPSQPVNRRTSRRYSLMVSGLSDPFARMKASSFTAGSLRFELRILSRIPVSLALVPRVGLYAAQGDDLGAHVADQLLVI